MNIGQTDKLFESFNINPPAPENVIISAERSLHAKLPDGYMNFLNQANGGEGFIGSNYLILWPIEQIKELNEAYQVKEFAPGLLLFGSSGGGEAYAFDMRFEGSPIVQVPFVGMALKEVWDVAPNFQDFLKKLSQA